MHRGELSRLIRRCRSEHARAVESFLRANAASHSCHAAHAEILAKLARLRADFGLSQGDGRPALGTASAEGGIARGHAARATADGVVLVRRLK